MSKTKKIKEEDYKPDLYEGKSDIPEILKKRKKLEKNQIPFRVNASTVILVDPKNATEEYRQKYLKRVSLTDIKKL